YYFGWIPSPNFSSSEEEVERDPNRTTDQVHISSLGGTARVPSLVIQPAPTSKLNEIPERNPHQPPIPYPLSFAEALAKIPKYAKMLKDLLTNKEKLLELANTPLNENCSAVLLKECLALANLEFDIEIRDKKGARNLAADHLSRLENPHQGNLFGMEMNDNFPRESLKMISIKSDDEPLWFFDIANYLVGGVWMGRKPWIFYKLVTLVPPEDIMDILEAWYTIYRDAHDMVKQCDTCQR
ncbi:hypothetical protein Tco_1443272, partial [Tanacetum coccineum]